MRLIGLILFYLLYFAAGFADADDFREYRNCRNCNPEQLAAFFNDTDKPYEAFQLEPLNSNGRVAVLFHGLSDSPYYMKDLAQMLFRNGFHVVVPLMKGHGDSYHELEKVTSDEWMEQAKQVVENASKLGPDLIVGGFSNGGLLASRLAADPTIAEKIKGLVLFAPALRLPMKYAVMGHAAKLLEIFSRIVQISSVKNLYSRFLQIKVSKNSCKGCTGPVRYSDIPMNGLVQARNGVSSLNKSLSESKINIPTYMVLSSMDNIVDVQRTAKVFSENFQGPKHLFWIDSAKTSTSKAAENILAKFSDSELTRVVSQDYVSHSGTAVEEPGLGRPKEKNQQMGQIHDSLFDLFFTNGMPFSCQKLF